jgi:tripartite-type tricarboxylate transporter receptor subunit TctC
VSSWQALVAPAGTPAAIVKRLNAAVLKVLALPDLKAQFAKLGVQPSPTTPAAAAEHIHSEIALWKKVAHEAGVQPQ